LSSLTDSSLKLLTRKLSDISNGVGALLSDCRGSDCDTLSRKTPSDPQTPDRSSSLERNGSLDRHGSLERNGSVSSGSHATRHHSRNTSLRSNASSRSGGLDSNLYPLSEKGSSPSPSHHLPHSPRSPSPSVQYIGQSGVEADSIRGRRQSQEFSEISSMLAEEDSVRRVTMVMEQCRKQNSAPPVNPGRPADKRCKPSQSSGVSSVVPVKSKCCSVV
jgi:hypothetical protein